MFLTGIQQQAALRYIYSVEDYLEMKLQKLLMTQGMHDYTLNRTSIKICIIYHFCSKKDTVEKY